VDDRTRGGGINRMSTNRKNTSYHVHERPGRIARKCPFESRIFCVFCVSDVYVRYDPDVREARRGGSLFKTKLDKGGEWTKKAVFDRTYFMDDP